MGEPVIGALMSVLTSRNYGPSSPLKQARRWLWERVIAYTVQDRLAPSPKI